MGAVHTGSFERGFFNSPVIAMQAPKQLITPKTISSEGMKSSVPAVMRKPAIQSTAPLRTLSRE